MRTAIVTLSELKRGNTRMCLSAKRGVGRCMDCRLYDTCESRIVNPEYDKLMAERRAELDRHRAAKKAIDKAIREL